MTNRLGELDLQEAAQQAAGNWQDFECFVWYRNAIDDAENWAIIYTHNRDSGLLDLSNADAIQKELESFAEAEDPDLIFESHDHWAVGHVDGFSIRVVRDGQITAAFRKYHDLAERLAEYPILDENDYSNREYEATVENIADAAWRLKDDFELPEDWTCEAYDWLSNNDSAAVENSDDQGGYPSEESLRTAFEALGFPQMETV